MMLLLLTKTFLQLILFSVFILMYGIPAFERFIKHETIVLESVENRGGIEAPSITIIAYSPATAMGWRVKPEEPLDAITVNCKNFSDFEQCLDAETFHGCDLIKDTLIGYEARLSLGATDEIWESDFTIVKAGRSYTLNPDIKIGPNYGQDQLFVLLDRAYSHTLMVHDKVRFHE